MQIQSKVIAPFHQPQRDSQIPTIHSCSPLFWFRPPFRECPRFGGFTSRDDFNDRSSSSDCSEWNGALGSSGLAGQVGEGGSHVHGDLSGTVVAGYRFRSPQSKISAVSRQTIPLKDTAHGHRLRTPPTDTAQGHRSRTPLKDRSCAHRHGVSRARRGVSPFRGIRVEG